MKGKLPLHGGDIYAKGKVLDFSANINPLGMPPGVRQAVIEGADSWERYPDPFCRELVKKLSEYEGVSEDRIAVGNGADDLIYRLCRVLRADSGVVCAPSFSEYGRALRESGSLVRTYRLKEESGFELDRGIADFCRGSGAVFVCCPNNPSGAVVKPEITEELAAECEKNGQVLIYDQCFLDFVKGGGEFGLERHMGKNGIIIKAFTKIFAMPGLRLGYMVFGSRELCEKVRSCGQYWPVSAPAQAAGIAALREAAEHIRRTAGYVEKERKALEEGLRGLGLKVYGSRANFLLFRGREDLGERLASRGILIRSLENEEGLGGGFFRTAVRTVEEDRRLLQEIREVI